MTAKTKKRVTKKTAGTPLAASSKAEHKKILARERKRRQRDREKGAASGAPAAVFRPGGMKAAPTDMSATAQLIDTSPQGPMTPWFNDYIFRKVDGNFYEVLREGVPIVDAAIGRLVALNGTIKIIGDNMALVKELEDFCLNVPVNDMQKGVNAFLQNASNEVFEQGFSISEFIATPKRDDIERLRVADSKRLFFRRGLDGSAEPWYRTGYPLIAHYVMPASIINDLLNARYGQQVSYNGVCEVKLAMDNKFYFSINNENCNPYGVSLIRSLEFVSQVLVTIHNNIKNVAERYGDPMYHVHVATKSREGNLEERRQNVEKEFNKIITAKRQGQSGDLVTAGGADSTVSINVIGHQGQIMQYQYELQHIIDQVVSRFGIPAWLLGLTLRAQGIAQYEIEAALSDSKVRQTNMLPEFIRLFSNFLKLRGRTWKSVTTSPDKPGDWGIIFETPNLRDIVAQAQARFLTAQADLMTTGAAAAAQTSLAGGASMEIEGTNYRFPLFMGGKGKEDAASGVPTKCTCGKNHAGAGLALPGVKEIQRPKPWPELDKVETDYETQLKTSWADLKRQVMTILKLNNVKSVGAGQALPGKEGAASGALTKDPGDPPNVDSFTFTEEQRQAIMDSMKQWIGTFDISDPDSVVKWYYGQAYSLGLIQAANLIGKERPILDIIKNSDIYDQLVSNGFQLVKDNATTSIKDDILSEIQNQVLAGSNSRHVSDVLDGLFEGQNSDWERLARSEMSMAAEEAKLDEWAEWKVEKVEFVPAPDACPICFAVSGEYEIGSCPIPVADTHPRCRCSTRPVATV